MQRLFALLPFFVAACATGTQWTDVRREFDYRPPPGVNFVVIERAGGTDIDEAIRRLCEGLTKELASRGLTARQLTYPGLPPVLYLDIQEWEPGNRFERWLGFGGGEARLVVDARFVRGGDGRPALMGRVRAFVRGGFYGGSAMTAPELAAESIARFVASGATPED